jgi:hypothetical protein
MSHLLELFSASVLAVHHAWQHSSHSVAPAAAQVSLSSGDSPFMGILVIGQLYSVQYKSIFGMPNKGQTLYV